MEGVNISWRVARILSKDQGRDFLLVPASGERGLGRGLRMGVILMLPLWALIVSLIWA